MGSLKSNLIIKFVKLIQMKVIHWARTS